MVLKKKTRIYLAGPLFSLAEKEFNQNLKEEMQAMDDNYEILLPQVFCVGLELHKMFSVCLKNIDRSELILAVLDGADADSGTSFELGYAYAKGKPVIGLRTDLRESEDRGLNLMLANCCTVLVRDKKATLKETAHLLLGRIQLLVPVYQH